MYVTPLTLTSPPAGVAERTWRCDDDTYAILRKRDRPDATGDTLTELLYRALLLRTSINEIGRWSESVAKDDELMPVERIQGAFTERARTLTNIYSPENSVSTV